MPPFFNSLPMVQIPLAQSVMRTYVNGLGRDAARWLAVSLRGNSGTRHVRHDFDLLELFEPKRDGLVCEAN